MSRRGWRGKGNFKPWHCKRWCLPDAGAKFVCRVEDVLDLYEQEYDPVMGATRVPQAPTPGRGVVRLLVEAQRRRQHLHPLRTHALTTQIMMVQGESPSPTSLQHGMRMSGER